MPRISARVRILLWLLLVLTAAPAVVAATTRGVLMRDVDQHISQMLSQETGEFQHFFERGRDPETGERFHHPERLLKVFLERQYADPDEELLGLIERPRSNDPRDLTQPREISVPKPLKDDREAQHKIFTSAKPSGTLDRGSAGELRWSKVTIEAEPRAAFVVAFYPEREREEVNEVFWLLTAISGISLIFTAGVGWLIAGRILKPVRLVRTTAAELTEQDLTRRIPFRGRHDRDDIAALAATFNAMLDRLESAFAAQRNFVDDAGHELRTPITIVRGHLELMGDDPAEREETVRLVTDELDRMSRIVEDLLLLAKAERPDFTTPEPVQLAELTADVFVKVRTLGDRDWKLAEVADAEVRIDPQRITQAMVQLAQNAVQHTAPTQRIEIGSRLRPDAIELYVADHGPGVQPQDAAVIFDRFRRGTARRGARGGGAGLGLAIVKAIAEAHHGHVDLTPTEGGGATFTLVLPEDRP
ncbi:sensor histidine kinase [Streptomyces boninensis]|uniref:sensor histidine kinase n=1 Tax=Streptomyces boninensis TaxID=2039455 RepID=UPI003B2169A7